MKHYLLLALSYVLSELLQWYFKIRWRFGLKEGTSDLMKNGDNWTNVEPFTGAPTEGYNSTYYGKRYHYGEYAHSMHVSFKKENGNSCFWLLELEHQKLQEVDVFETMAPKGKPGIYFSVYNNEESSDYYGFDKDGNPIDVFDRFQTRMRGIRMLTYLVTNKIEYKIKWTPKYIIWYIADIPVSISFVYIPVQPMWLILSSMEDEL